jgi:hypothetical protein
MSIWALAAVPLVIGIASSLLSDEIKGWLTRTARDGVREAAALLPEPEASHQAREWEARLHDLAEEPIRAYLYAKRLRFVAIRMSRESARAARNSKLSELRRAVIQRSAGRCAACCRSFDPLCLELHRIAPVARGGATAIENLLLLCAECHRMLPPDQPPALVLASGRPPRFPPGGAGLLASPASSGTRRPRRPGTPTFICSRRSATPQTPARPKTPSTAG